MKNLWLHIGIQIIIFIIFFFQRKQISNSKDVDSIQIKMFILTASLAFLSVINTIWFAYSNLF